LVAVAVLIPTVAILHAVDTSSSNTATSHDDERHDQDQDHDGDETSDDNSVTHADLDDANENASDMD
jgi:hypothetical protein